jgi:divalent metal cation (Fe/Co/Zn/Cd) transporter
MQYIRAEKAPELPVVLLEDVGAEIGLFMALTGVLLAHYTGEPRWDAIGSIGIGILLVAIAITLAVEMKGLLVGESASPQNDALIIDALTATENVRGVIHMKTLHIGPDELIVAAKVEFEPTLTISELATSIDAAERALRAAVPIAELIYIEPDVRRAAVDSTPT